ncbi:MAG: PTS sugar transporter subunit IIA [Deltaproteobacteria bacterium]
MIGVLITTHGRLGHELVKVAELIKGQLKAVLLVSIEEDKSMEATTNEMAGTIKKLDDGDGVVVLTDLFGGTPSNIALSFVKKRKMEVVTGVNLPMLLKLYDIREENNLRKLACDLKESGRNNIYVAGEFLEKNSSTT